MHTLKLSLARRRVSLFIFAALLLLCSLVKVEAQNVRYSVSFPSVSSTTATPFLVANVPPNSPVIAVCNSPANQVPCTNYATTYTSAGVACANGSQDTPDPQPSACQSTGDAQGNIGWWAPAGKYDYTVCIKNSVTCSGPYTVTLGGSTTLEDCGSTSTCAKTQQAAALVVRGSVAFPTASSVTVTSLPFSTAASYSCTAGDFTAPAGIVNATTYTSGSSVTFTETGGANTDTMRYICVGF